MSMAAQEFYIDYFGKKYLDSKFPNAKNKPHFQLAYGDKGGSICGAGGDPYEKGDFRSYKTLSSPNNFPALAREMLKHLEKNDSLNHVFKIKFSKDASAKTGKIGKKVLEGIIGMHNFFVDSGKKIL